MEFQILSSFNAQFQSYFVIAYDWPILSLYPVPDDSDVGHLKKVEMCLL